MKKIIFTLLIGMLSVTFAQAQLDAGTKYLGGNFNLGFGSTKSSVDGTSTDGPSTFNFGITPKIGFFLSDNFQLGLGIGYNMASTKLTDGDDEMKASIGMFTLAPYARYYMMPTEKMGFFIDGTIGFGFGTGKDETTIDGTTTTQETKMSEFGVGITPGVVIFISEKVAFEATFGGLFYTMGKEKWTEDEVDMEDSYSDFGLEINPSVFTFGVAVHIP